MHVDVHADVYTISTAMRHGYEYQYGLLNQWFI